MSSRPVMLAVEMKGRKDLKSDSRTHNRTRWGHWHGGEESEVPG